ncbi:unnamed protein product [Brassicogethes aeneus]|uniref:Uncharacterized protein n=1 Tax=Brassicogethes aeneus TaxID=1431903 RepID=A0A9P0B9A9_BRAAE|nr:unnamed protein product [Brassicogethes aeneus]
MILTIAPKSWNRLDKEFGTSRRQAKNAKELVKKYGIMSTHNPREGRKMEPKTETLVNDFYLREDNSRVMPGKKDFVSIKKDDGQREHLQKQLIICDVKELLNRNIHM